MNKKNNRGRSKKKEILTTVFMLLGLGIGVFTLTGCGEGLLSCLCPGCDGKPSLTNETVPALVLTMEPKGCLGDCLSCFGCNVLQYSESDAAACLGCYDATYYGCYNCGADTDKVDISSFSVDTTTIIPGKCYNISISDNGQDYSHGCLFKETLI